MMSLVISRQAPILCTFPAFVQTLQKNSNAWLGKHNNVINTKAQCINHAEPH